MIKLNHKWQFRFSQKHGILRGGQRMLHRRGCGFKALARHVDTRMQIAATLMNIECRCGEIRRVNAAGRGPAKRVGAGSGRRGPADQLVAEGGAPGGAAPYVTGRAALQLGRARRAGNPASKDASQASWRLPPLHPLARFARDWQSSDALRRENAEGWLFEIVDRQMKRTSAQRHGCHRPALTGRPSTRAA